MHRCPACDEMVDHEVAVCMYCGYCDCGWEENLRAAQGSNALRVPVYHAPPRYKYSIPISSFADTGYLGHELALFERGWRDHNALDHSQTQRPLLRFDLSPLGHDWDASIVMDDLGEVLPANVGVLALMEARRAIDVAAHRWARAIEIEALLPPTAHPVTDFIKQANLIPQQARAVRTHGSSGVLVPFGAIETIVAATRINAATRGQLSQDVYRGLDALSDTGGIKASYHRHLRRALMELADNGYQHGGGDCTVALFLRDEGAMGSQAAARLPLSPSAAHRIHIYLHCYTSGPTFAKTLGLATERTAVDRVLSNSPATSAGNGLGLGVGGPVYQARDMAGGTIYICSGNYTRVVLPTGMVREWTTEMGVALPGVHVCLLVPLANVTALTMTQAS